MELQDSDSRKGRMLILQHIALITSILTFTPETADACLLC